MHKLKARPDLLVILFIIMLAITFIVMAIASYMSGANLPYVKNY